VDRDIFMAGCGLQRGWKTFERSEFVTKMTLKSALQDVRETTLAGVSGLLAKLSYLASLRRRGRYEHWGMEFVHGTESCERALRTAHIEVVSGVLRAPLASLERDLQESSQNSGLAARDYLNEMRDGIADLLPADRKDSPEASHLNSVLAALSSLEKSRARATRSTS
jgi:hypothetical protein